VPALPPYLIEPIWQQFKALLPERKVDHPLGCHRPRIPERVVFEKLVQVLVFGCAYWRIADESCSATTLRDRRDEWIESGVMDELREMVLEIYDRFIGLEVAEMAIDCCITKAPCGGEKAGRNPVDRGKQGIKRSVAVDERGIPLGATIAPANRHDQPPRLAAFGPHPRCGSRHAWISARGYERPPRPRLRLRSDPRAPGGEGAIVGDLQERQAGTLLGHVSVGRRAYERVAQRPQEVGVVHGAGGEGDRLLDGLL
jgi:transposase